MNHEKLKSFYEKDRFAAFIGVEIIEVRSGYCKAKLEIKDQHLNAANVVQGGAIFTLADMAFAVASNSHGKLALSINANISFLKGKTKGTLYATATEIGDPKRIGAYNVLITDEEDQTIACFNGIVYRKDENKFIK